MRIFTKYYWNDVYYNIKHGINNIFIYLPIVWKMRGWDYHYILEMNKFQLSKLHNSIKNGHEIEEDRIVKEKDIKRCMELIDGILKDDYEERCGYDHSRVNLSFKPIGDEGDTEMINDHPNKHTEKELTKIFKESEKLKNKELKELFSIMEKNILTWWS